MSGGGEGGIGTVRSNTSWDPPVNRQTPVQTFPSATSFAGDKKAPYSNISIVSLAFYYYSRTSFE